jgi:hypothetical protein
MPLATQRGSLSYSNRSIALPAYARSQSNTPGLLPRDQTRNERITFVTSTVNGTGATY